MHFLLFESAQAASQKAYELIQEAKFQGAQTFGLATGGTPEQLYAILRSSDIDFSDSYAINLDEYIGLDPTHPQSYAQYMQKNLFSTKPFKATYIPNGSNPDVAAETAAYEKIIEDHPIDLQILGIGTNGHIGFNEPGTPFDSKTSLVDLTASTIQANKRYFESEEEVPTQAYSMGIGTILKAKKIILLAFGSSKAQTIADLFSGNITIDNPASALHHHHDVSILLDPEAALYIKDKLKN